MPFANIWERDSFAVQVTVLESGVAKDISGSTIAGTAVRRGKTVAPTIDPTDLQNGIFTLTWAKDAIDVPGSWTVQARVDLGAESQVVFDDAVQVKPAQV